ncbi:hypothetical protein BCR33DRAFT_717854 [Rhizoclosmatium globosum]|uniref:MIT domain-containing protein n=1 Tax=Rhizoclosmatium globosum TaxID=329046 RepID=A0A1Y2C7V9_9FUNG|nr:hypothetical protein BCR33DRAFT_717854 [Rhizoclosmatium globosum]|eukprot:ORY43121.1 hypothetical protein BCR33DRAFT_717854 [Rhizoclosmatium globosum]
MSLEKALQQAQEAVRFDEKGEYINALNSYRRSLLILDRVLGNVDMATAAPDAAPEVTEPLDRDSRLQVIKLRSRYVSRVEEVLATVPASVAAVYSGQSFEYPVVGDVYSGSERDAALKLVGSSFGGAETLYLDVVAAATDLNKETALPDARIPMVAAIPSTSRHENIAARLRTAAAALCRRGAFVSPRLAVPHEAAAAAPPGAKLVAIELKMNALTAMAQCPSQSTQQSLQQDIAITRDTVDAVLQQPLLKKLAGEIPNPFEESMQQQQQQQSKSIFKTMFAAAATAVQTIPKGEKVNDLGPYTDAVGRTFSLLASLLDSWGAILAQNQRLASNQALMADMEHILKFVEGVLLAFVVRDLERLIERFLRKVTAAAIAV